MSTDRSSIAVSRTATPQTQSLSPAVRHALEFTRVYRAHRDSHPAVREAACLRAQFPAVLAPIAPGEMYAGGHVRERIVYHGTIWWTTFPSRTGPGKQGGYCFDFSALKRYEDSPADREALAGLDEFWSAECTWSRIYATWDDDLKRNIHGRPVSGGGSGFVAAVEVDRLLRRGIPGMAAAVRERAERARSEGETEKLPFLSALGDSVALLGDICAHYERQARALASDATSAQDRARLDRIAGALAALREREPRTLFEAIQLWWLYSVMTCGLHIEGWRLDVALGDFLAADIDSGRLTEEEALEQIGGLWRMFARHSDPAVSRAIVGGRGRRNERNADRFCMAAMEVTRRLKQVIPQFTLRFYDGQDPALLRKAYDCIGEGGTYPMLYNDDAIVPGIMKALHASRHDAERYYPLGCGEYLIGGATPSLLTVGWSVPRSLEAALFGGRCAQGMELGPPGPTSFETFDGLWQAFVSQCEYGARNGVALTKKNVEFARHDCPFLLASLLMDDCLERGLPILEGGARFVGSCIMGHGFSNAADALTAIKTLVFDTKTVTLDEVRAALRDDFAGHEPLRRRLLAAPKFGNDDPLADGMLVRLWREISRVTDEAGRGAGFDFFTVSSVNPGGYSMGEECGATADGRHAREPFAIGNAPTAGMDTHGITAMLNSILKVDPACGGATTNIKLGRNFIARHREKFDALMGAFWKRGGMQATITVVDQEELEDALKHPERYPNLLVRIGGWTARFVEQTPCVQREIIRRTIY